MSTSDHVERCIACAEPFTAGDEYLPDINGGSIHFACCGPEPDGFVNLETGEPLHRPPSALIWESDQSARRRADAGQNDDHV